MTCIKKGVACAGCPHRAAYVVCKQALGRGGRRVICGNAGCANIGEIHPAATTCPGGQDELLERYKQEVPVGGTPLAPSADACIHFALDSEVTGQDAGERFSNLAGEGVSTVLAILASDEPSLDRGAIEGLAEHAVALGACNVAVVDPLDTVRAGEIVSEALATPGIHGIIFASPCVLLQAERALQPVDIDRFACVGCHRCKQITGCPALVFAPPAYRIDADLCAGCDLCTAYCRTHIIYSPRNRMTAEERCFQRFEAARR